MNRRQFISSGVLAAVNRRVRAAQRDVKSSPARIVPETSGVRVDRVWDGDLCRSRLTNDTKRPVRIKEVVLFDNTHKLPPETHLYGDSFQMLSQTSGTLGKPVDLGYSELKHYKIPQPEGITAVTGLLTLTPPKGDTRVFAFTSCRRFIGRFYIQGQRVQAVADTEGLDLGPGETWDLEEFTATSGRDRAALLDAVGKRINANHPRLNFPKPPTGWCSWYCFGPRVT